MRGSHPAAVAFAWSIAGALFCISTSAAAQGATSSSTADDLDGIVFPEDSGYLPRAPMPEGAAPDGPAPRTTRPTPEGGVQDGLPRAPMPLGGAPEGPEAVDPEPPITPAPADRPATGADQKSGGGSKTPADTSAGRNGPLPAADREARRRPPIGVPEGAPATGAVLGGPTGPIEPARKFGDFADGLARDYGLSIAWNGYVRLVIEAIENDDRSEFIGRNDGFKLANARLGLRAGRGDFFAYVSVDAAAGEAETFNDPNQTFAVRPRDMFLRYRLADFASITVGRFKAPYDLGQLEATAYRVFIDQPVGSRGVLPTQGFEVDGLGQGRQLGAMVHRDRLGLNPDGFDVGYALAITNGRTRNLALNDNDRVAGFGRLSFYWSDVVQLNVAGFFDNRTVGELPDLFDEDVKGLEVSMLLQVFDFLLEGQLLYQTVGFELRPDVETIGAHGQVAYNIGAFQIAYRFAYYDPVDDPDDSDTVREHTLGVAYTTPSLPLRFVLNGTLADENDDVRVDNNRLAFLTQFVF